MASDGSKDRVQPFLAVGRKFEGATDGIDYPAQNLFPGGPAGITFQKLLY
jgi:hypothetical protein